MRTQGLFHPLWRQLNQFQGEMNRLFNNWTDGSWTGSVAGYPAVNMWEEGDEVHVEAELPGQNLKSLELQVTGGNQLTIKGEQKHTLPEKGVWHRRERGQGVFTRTLSLPFLVDADKVEARLENGVLQVKLAKHESAKPRKITVKAE
jgi:HSP20 family protein